MQPIFVPPNCRFEVDDYNLEFLDDDKFDLIHERELLGTVPDWTESYQKCFNALAPGGWLDIMEADVTTYYSAAKDGQSFDTLVPKEYPVKTMFIEACRKRGMEADIATKSKASSEALALSTSRSRSINHQSGPGRKRKRKRKRRSAPGICCAWRQD